jgi:hypothetical protein
VKLGIDWMIARADSLSKLDIIELARNMERGYLAKIGERDEEIRLLKLTAAALNEKIKRLDEGRE